MFSRRSLFGLLASVPLFPFASRRKPAAKLDMPIGMYAWNGKAHGIGCVVTRDDGPPRVEVSATGVTLFNCHMRVNGRRFGI